MVVTKAVVLVPVESDIGRVIAVASVAEHATWVGKELGIVAVTWMNGDGHLFGSLPANFVAIEIAIEPNGTEREVANSPELVVGAVGVFDAEAKFDLSLEIEAILVGDGHGAVVAAKKDFENLETVSSPEVESVVVASVFVLATVFVGMNVGVRAAAVVFPVFEPLFGIAISVIVVVTVVGSLAKFETEVAPVVVIVSIVEEETASGIDLVSASWTFDVVGTAEEDFEAEIVFVVSIVFVIDSALAPAGEPVVAAGPEAAAATSRVTGIEAVSAVGVTVCVFEVVLEAAFVAEAASVIVIETMVAVAAEAAEAAEVLTACVAVTVPVPVTALVLGPGSVSETAIETGSVNVAFAVAAVVVVVEIAPATVAVVAIVAVLVTEIVVATEIELVPAPVVVAVIVIATLTAVLLVAAFVVVTLAEDGTAFAVVVVMRGTDAEKVTHEDDYGLANSKQTQEKYFAMGCWI